MLTHLHIENYALIRHTDVELAPGFVVITGETGAGKSILMGALGLLLGNRADSQVLADKQRKCVVEGQFDIAGLDLQPFFEENELDYDAQLIVRREILATGKSRAFVNDCPATLPVLKQLGVRLVDIHAQNETSALAESAYQLSLLDSNAAQPLAANYAEAYARYAEAKRRLEQLTAQEAESRRDADYTQFLFDELDKARLVAGEKAELEKEQQLLEHAETIKEALGGVAALCDGEEDSAVARLATARSMLQRVAGCLPEVDELHQRLESTVIELQDILATVEHLDGEISYSAERQEAVDSRLDLLYRLEKKHGVEGDEALIAVRDQLDAKLQGIGTLDEQIRQAMEAVDAAFAQLQALAEQLTAQRKSQAVAVEKAVLPILAELGMPDAQISFAIAPAANYGPHGHDDVELLFNANKGGELRPLSAVASGGERSRLMLAIKSMGHEQVPTAVFDEIDSGVSGDISARVAGVMRRLAQHTQVIAITHQPQIAAAATQHYKVRKQVEGETTISGIAALDEQERVVEIASMLSTAPPTDAALRTAQELINANL